MAIELKIEYVPISELKKYDKNAKIHTEEQVEQIKESIKEFGMCDPIAVWKNNEIVEGHGRLLALQELGADKAPIIRLEHLTDEQRKAYGLVHNKLTMNTDFDLDMLTDELSDIGDIDMEQFGFELTDFDVPELDQDEDDTYTDVINIPHYKPSDENVGLEACYDTAKYERLCDEIDKADITDSERRFLKMAAARHVVFSYKTIADYYASATPIVQKLMEASALVIIDYDDAIKNGYTAIRQFIDEKEADLNGED